VIGRFLDEKQLHLTTAAASSENTGSEHAGVIEHQQISGREKLGKVPDLSVPDVASRRQLEESAGASSLGLLRDEL
jgi:hypothetical protein